MRITALTIENFKGVSNPVRIEFKPITLLFGPNSAGKSTIVQALHYVQEILERGNVDADRVASADDTLNLGGFKNLVNEHDCSKKIRLEVDFSIVEEDLPPVYTLENGRSVDLLNETGIQDGHEFGGLFCDINQVGKVEELSVRLEIAWDHFFSRPYLTSYSVAVNGEHLATIEADSDGKRIVISSLNMDHPSLAVDDSWDGLEEGESILALYGVVALNDSSLPSLDGNSEVFLGTQRTPLPVWGKPLHISVESHRDFIEEGNFTSEDFYYHLNSFSGYLSQILVGAGDVLRKELNRFRYIGPIRKVPPRNYDPVRSNDISRWTSGLAAWDRLHLGAPEFVKQVGGWLIKPDLLNTGYALKLRRYKEVDIESPLYVSLTTARFLDEDDDRFGELESLPERRELVLVDEKRMVQVFPQDVGVGISQLLPVVVGALDDDIDILMVEQPELHIHPGLQCRMGDLLINQIQNDDKMFIIETHSEHLLLRLLKRIREKYEGQLPPGLNGLSPAQLSVNYLELHEEEGMCISQLQVSEEGDSKGDWPPGFFEERAGELF